MYPRSSVIFVEDQPQDFRNKSLSYQVGSVQAATLLLEQMWQSLIDYHHDGAVVLDPWVIDQLEMKGPIAFSGNEPLIAHELKHIQAAYDWGIDLVKSALQIEVFFTHSQTLGLTVSFVPPQDADPFAVIRSAFAVDEPSDEDIGFVLNILRVHADLFADHPEFLSQLLYMLMSKPAFHAAPFDNPVHKALNAMSHFYPTNNNKRPA